MAQSLLDKDAATIKAHIRALAEKLVPQEGMSAEERKLMKNLDSRFDDFSQDVTNGLLVNKNSLENAPDTNKREELTQQIIETAWENNSKLINLAIAGYTHKNSLTSWSAATKQEKSIQAAMQDGRNEIGKELSLAIAVQPTQSAEKAEKSEPETVAPKPTPPEEKPEPSKQPETSGKTAVATADEPAKTETKKEATSPQAQYNLIRTDPDANPLTGKSADEINGRVALLMLQMEGDPKFKELGLNSAQKDALSTGIAEGITNWKTANQEELNGGLTYAQMESQTNMLALSVRQSLEKVKEQLGPLNGGTTFGMFGESKLSYFVGSKLNGEAAPMDGVQSVRDMGKMMLAASYGTEEAQSMYQGMLIAHEREDIAKARIANGFKPEDYDASIAQAVEDKRVQTHLRALMEKEKSYEAGLWDKISTWFRVIFSAMTSGHFFESLTNGGLMTAYNEQAMQGKIEHAYKSIANSTPEDLGYTGNQQDFPRWKENLAMNVTGFHEKADGNNSMVMPDGKIRGLSAIAQGADANGELNGKQVTYASYTPPAAPPPSDTRNLAAATQQFHNQDNQPIVREDGEILPPLALNGQNTTGQNTAKFRKNMLAG